MFVQENRVLSMTCTAGVSSCLPCDLFHKWCNLLRWNKKSRAAVMSINLSFLFSLFFLTILYPAATRMSFCFYSLKKTDTTMYSLSLLSWTFTSASSGTLHFKSLKFTVLHSLSAKPASTAAIRWILMASFPKTVWKCYSRSSHKSSLMRGDHAGITLSQR